MSYLYQAHPQIYGLNLIKSVHITAEPTAIPHTDDMRAMVEDLHKRGMIQRQPAMFLTPQGLVIHPVMLAKLKAHMQEKSDALLTSAIYGTNAFTYCPPN